MIHGPSNVKKITSKFQEALRFNLFNMNTSRKFSIRDDAKIYYVVNRKNVPSVLYKTCLKQFTRTSEVDGFFMIQCSHCGSIW